MHGPNICSMHWSNTHDIKCTYTKCDPICRSGEGVSESVWNVRGLRATSKHWSSPRGPHTITTPPPECHRIKDIGCWKADREICINCIVKTLIEMTIYLRNHTVRGMCTHVGALDVHRQYSQRRLELWCLVGWINNHGGSVRPRGNRHWGTQGVHCGTINQQ